MANTEKKKKKEGKESELKLGIEMGKIIGDILINGVSSYLTFLHKIRAPKHLPSGQHFKIFK